MNNSSHNKNVCIEISKNEQKYYVSLKPHDQVKQIFCNITLDETYKHVLMFLFGYLANQIEKYPITTEKFKSILSELVLIFDMNIQLKII